jgi:DNA-binding transcriptional MerR regulator
MPRLRRNGRKTARVSAGSASYMSRSAVCRLGGITESELMLWEYEEFVAPAAMLQVGRRSEPLYDESSLRRIRTIRTLAEELGVNLPGIGVILHLLDQMTAPDARE